MRSRFVLLFSVLILNESFAQDGYGSTSVYDRVATLPRGKHLYIIPPNNTWELQGWKDSVYRFDSFQLGKLEMTNGFVPSHRPMLNYNILLGTIDIKQEKTGSVVRMRKSPAIKTVWIGDHKFINDPREGYLEIILDGAVAVAQKSYMDGLYELSNGNKYPMSALMDTKVQSVRTTQYFWQEELIFIVRKDLRAFRVTKGLLLRQFPKQRSKVKAFSKSNRINYKKKEDVLKIVAFANEQVEAAKTN